MVVKFRDLRDDSARDLGPAAGKPHGRPVADGRPAAAAQLGDLSTSDLAREVERLRLEVALATAGGLPPGALGGGEGEGAGLPPHLARFQTPDDFTVREQTQHFTNGDTYTGETLGSLWHGRGVHTCSNGDRYEGQWRYGKRDGRGRMTFTNGKEYDGEWQDDKAHGQGAAKYECGCAYVGEFCREQRAGWGTHYFPNGDTYEGEWAADTITGKGRYTYTDGTYFEGEWLEGSRVKGKLMAGDGSSEYSGGWRGAQRHGYGVQFQRGLFNYVGGWAGDLQEGEGRCIWADGSQYDGQWVAGQRHGRGKYSFNAYRYEGEWRQDRQHGAGACVTEVGDRYVGEFAEGKRHGRGRCLYADGSKYEGEWQDDVRHGQGTCLFASGDKYQGEWKADKRHGRGVCRFADGRKFRGEWQDDGWLQSAAEPQRCRVAGPGVTRAVAGQTAELLIEARDDGGCRRLCGGDEFQVALHGPETVTAEVGDNGDGTYAVTYTATRAGTYELHITAGAEEHVAQSPYPLRVLPARPVARRCQVAGGGRSCAVAGQQAEFAVEAHDEFGNRWQGLPEQLAHLLPLEATLSAGDGSEAAVQLRPAADGRFACIYTAPTPGYWRLNVTCHGQPLPRTPYSVHVTDPAAPPVGAALPAEAAAATAEASGRAAASNGAAPAAPPRVRDESRVWEALAAAAFAEPDGSMEGWDSEGEERPQSSEARYIQAHPGVPVVESLEDIWKVSRLQRERKAREEAQKAARLQGMRSQLEQAFGAAQPPSPAEVAAAVSDIVAADAGGAAAASGAPAPQSKAGGQPAPATDATAPVPGADSSAGAAAAARPAGAPAGRTLLGRRAGRRAAAAALAQLD